MAFSGTVYTGPSGSTNAAPGQVVQSTVWNNINTDYATALTMLMSQLAANMTDRNILNANGGFEVWQRGAGASSSIAIAATTTAYTADRWYLTTLANQASVVSAQLGLSSNSILSARVLRNAAQTGVGVMTYGCPLDTDEIIRMRGKNVSLSFLAATGANWSPASGTLVVALYTGTGSVAKRGAGFTGEVSVLSISTNIAAGSAATAIAGESLVVVPTNATQAELQFTWTPVGTAGAADYIQLDDVELDAAYSSADWTPMQFDRVPFDVQLAHCKRHFQKTFDYSVAPAQSGGFPGSISTLVQVAATRVACWWQYPVEMRVTGSNTTFNPAAASANWINASVSVSVVVSVDATLSQCTKGVFIHSAATSSPAAGTNMYIQAVVDAGI